MRLPDPEPGDFAVCSTAGGVGFGVSLGELANGSGFSQWDHVIGYLGGMQIAETNPGGARIREIKDFQAGHGQILWSTGVVQLTSSQRAKIVAQAIAWADAKLGYSALDYFAMAAHRLHLHPLDNLLRDRIADSNHLICSQFWDKAYELAGVHLFDDGRWNGYVDPASMGKLIVSAKRRWQ